MIKNALKPDTTDAENQNTILEKEDEEENEEIEEKHRYSEHVEEQEDQEDQEDLEYDNLVEDLLRLDVPEE